MGVLREKQRESCDKTFANKISRQKFKRHIRYPNSCYFTLPLHTSFIETSLTTLSSTVGSLHLPLTQARSI